MLINQLIDEDSSLLRKFDALKSKLLHDTHGSDPSVVTSKESKDITLESSLGSSDKNEQEVKETEEKPEGSMKSTDTPSSVLDK